MASKIAFSDYLTRPEGDDESRRRAMTYVGMAHFAGSGPPGQTCRGCEHWLTNGWHADKMSHRGALKDSVCDAYVRMKGKAASKSTPKVPHSAWACRYFEPREQPVRLHAPRPGEVG